MKFSASAVLVLVLSQLAVSGAFALDRRPYTDADFAAAEAGGAAVVIHVSAAWCGTCQAQEKVLDALSARPDLADLTILRVDYDAQRDVMQRFNTPFRSTFVVLRNGGEVARMSAGTAPAEIEALLVGAAARR